MGREGLFAGRVGGVGCAIELSEAEYERGEYVEYGPEDKGAFLSGVIERGRAALAAEKKAS